ncbi:MAG: phytoene/squalene synthase family protein [Planctomycetota bacterium]
MIRPQHAIHSSYALCRAIARRSGSNFYPCFWLLPRPKRRAMEALYAFTRYTDDLIDNPDPVDARRAALARWRIALEAALSDTSDLAAADGALHGRSQTPDQLPGEALLPALSNAASQFHIPSEHLLAVVDGVEMDLDGARYETFDELAVYCQRVASAVGLACIHVWGFRGEAAFEPARKCGIAFQITNILRDLKEDARQGRVYLPREDFRRAGYSVEDLSAGVTHGGFDRLMEFQVDRARLLYREGAELFDWLEPDGRRIFGMMTAVYHRLLVRIERRPSEVFRRRVRLTGWEKLAIATRWALLPARRSALP